MALQSNIQHMDFLLSIFPWQNPQSYFLSLLHSIFWAPVLSDFGHNVTCNLRHTAKQKLKSQVLFPIKPQNALNIYVQFQKEYISVHYLPGCWPLTQNVLSKWWAWDPATSRCAFPTESDTAIWSVAIVQFSGAPCNNLPGDAASSAHRDECQQQCSQVITSKDNYKDYTCLHYSYCWKLLFP